MAAPLILAPGSLHAAMGGPPSGGRAEVALRPLPVADGRRTDPYRLTDRLRGLVAEVADDGHVVDRVVVVVPRRRGAARAVPGPVLDLGDRLLPVGVLGADRPADLHAWWTVRGRRDAVGAGADTGVLDDRGRSPDGGARGGPVVAAMGTDRFLEPAGRWLAALSAAGLAPVDRRASCTRRAELADALAAGPDLVLYLGHGHHLGWSGYQGLRWQHLPPQRRPIGTLVALACATLAQPNGQRGFGVRLVEEGRALASVGAVRPLPIAELITLGDALVAGLRLVAAPAPVGGALAPAELVAAVPPDPTIGALFVALAAAVDGHGPLAGEGVDGAVVARVLRSLRVVGDPGAPIGPRRSAAGTDRPRDRSSRGRMEPLAARKVCSIPH